MSELSGWLSGPTTDRPSSSGCGRGLQTLLTLLSLLLLLLTYLY